MGGQERRRDSGREDTWRERWSREGRATQMIVEGALSEGLPAGFVEVNGEHRCMAMPGSDYAWCIEM